MKEPDKGVILIRQLSRRIDEFLDENEPETFASMTEMRLAFSRWLLEKENSA